jgi:hypothetical protein
MVLEIEGENQASLAGSHVDGETEVAGEVPL